MSRFSWGSTVGSVRGDDDGEPPGAGIVVAVVLAAAAAVPLPAVSFLPPGGMALLWHKDKDGTPPGSVVLQSDLNSKSSARKSIKGLVVRANAWCGTCGAVVAWLLDHFPGRLQSASFFSCFNHGDHCDARIGSYGGMLYQHQCVHTSCR